MRYLFIILLFVGLYGCSTPEERWMASEREKINKMSVMGIRDNKFVMEIRYTLPKDLAYTIKTGNVTKDSVVEGAKDVMVTALNVAGVAVSPWFVGIPVAGYVASAIVQKMGDTSFVSNTIEIPMDNVKEISIGFENDSGRKDIKYINIKK